MSRCIIIYVDECLKGTGSCNCGVLSGGGCDVNCLNANGHVIVNVPVHLKFLVIRLAWLHISRLLLLLLSR